MANKRDTMVFLVLAGVILLIDSIFLQYFLPYFKDLSTEQRDQFRIININKLESQINSQLLASSTKYLGDNNTIYISLPSNDQRCSDIKLPALPLSWKYHCSNFVNYKNTDGSGWIPTSIDNTKISELPIDPKNSSESLNYFAFVTNTDDKMNSKYVLTSSMESKKYIQKYAYADGGNDPTRYESGNNIHLWGDALGLVAFWPINEGDGFNINDNSNFHNEAKLQSLQNWEKNQLHFDKDNFVIVKDSNILNTIGKEEINYTIVISFKSDVSKDQSISEKWSDGKYPFSIRGPSPNIRFALYDGEQNPFIATEKDYSDSKWHQLVAGRNVLNKSIFLYVDGKLIKIAEDKTSDDISNKGSFPIGARYTNGSNPFEGYIKDFYIFERSLSEIEITKIYQSNSF